MEELLVKKIEAGIRAIKFGTKTKETAEVGYSLNRLKSINPYLYEDLLIKYKQTIK